MSETKKVRVIRIAVPEAWAQRVWSIINLALDSTGCPDYTVERDDSPVVVPAYSGRVTVV